eukprot:scaffold5490_cov125-Cylindrotheca_fusiformis.AAC.20
MNRANSIQVVAALCLLIYAPPCYAFTPNLLSHGKKQHSSTRLFSELSPIPSEWQGEVLQSLKAVIDPDLNQDIVTLGFVKNLRLDEETREVAFDVELTTPACPVKDQFATDCEQLVMDLPWTKKVSIQMTAQESSMETDTFGMSQVGAVIAVSSCKGGVGKSTTAVNLAYALQSLGASVGIFDADVYGPSLPTMIQPDDDIVRFVGRQIAPLQRNGVKLMSFGYVNDGSAVMRGPMVTQLLDQFLSVTQWGSLDYLILDMPPGTGDIQLTLTQRLNITAAVIVTTPQELSFADVVRGVEMFDSVNVPCIAVVENMAYYQVNKERKFDQDKMRMAIAKTLAEKGIENTEGSSLADELVQVVLQNTESDRIRIFGPGHKARLSEQWGIEQTFSMPLLDQIATNGDSGTPFILEQPDSEQATIYKALASAVVTEIAKTKHSQSRPKIEYDKDSHLLTIDEDNKNNSEEEEEESVLSPATLRRACRCAACVEEMTGRQLLKPTDIPETIEPMQMSSTGNYALSVNWSDGHRSLYPYRQIRRLLEEQKSQTNDDEENNPNNSSKSATTTKETRKERTVA